MTALGLVHVLLMVFSLGAGLVILPGPKGTARHRRLGRLFVAGMVVSNVIVLGLYRDSGQPGIFHALAIVSIVSLSGAVALVRMPGVGMGRRIAHGHVMLWSYGGVVAAGFGQGASAAGFSPWPIILFTFAIVALGAYRTDFAGLLKDR